MKKVHDLSQLEWELSGWIPNLWKFHQMVSLAADKKPDAILQIPARVPGSVQAALREAGVIPDWNVGLNARQCEWVENRHWIFETVLPDEWFGDDKTYRLYCLGLDYIGEVRLNNQVAGEFCGTHIPHIFDLTPHLVETANVLHIAFELPPRWLGQFGYTSKMTEWKTRFNYTWDWQPRMVQCGIWDAVTIEELDGAEIEAAQSVAGVDLESNTGTLLLKGKASAPENAKLQIVLKRDCEIVREADLSLVEYATGVSWQDLPVELWWPNGEGAQPLYDLEISLLAADGAVLDSNQRRVGFRDISWRACEGAPPEADPWICVVNGRPVFLQGVNFPPMLSNYADVTADDYRAKLKLYQSIGVNVFRLNACQYLEKQDFYDICDESGLFVWQEFPLTSSGVENVPPSDENSIRAVEEIASSFIVRRRHHASLLMWSCGNELLSVEGWRPIGFEHPMLANLKRVVAELDPERRLIPASPSGPRMGSSKGEYGKGLHWDVHGVWAAGDIEAMKEEYVGDDALFRSEAISAGAAPAELIRQYAGELNPLPISAENPLWRNPVGWWLEAQHFLNEFSREPESLEEYVSWSRDRQAKMHLIAVESCKRRFPACGGVLLWCGHDCFPCPTNTSIIDFHNNPKPSALSLSYIYKTSSEELRSRSSEENYELALEAIEELKLVAS